MLPRYSPVVSLSFFLCLAAACDTTFVEPEANIDSRFSEPGVLEKQAPVVVSEALMFDALPNSWPNCTPFTCKTWPGAGTGDECVVGRRFELVSRGAQGLAIESYQVPVRGCALVHVHPRFWRFDVESVEYENGSKHYYASGDDGHVFLTDQRPSASGDVPPWTAVVNVDKSDAAPWSPSYQAFFAKAVENTNRPASGQTLHRLLVGVSDPVPEDQLALFAYPMKLEEQGSERLDPATYRLEIESDLSALHVAALLKEMSRVDYVIALT